MINKCILVDSCGSVLNSSPEIRSLTSINFPQPYPSNQDCTWTIVAPEGFYIKIEANLVNVEYCCDHLQVIKRLKLLSIL